jgi:hypothetical protein
VVTAAPFPFEVTRYCKPDLVVVAFSFCLSKRATFFSLITACFASFSFAISSFSEK